MPSKKRDFGSCPTTTTLTRPPSHAPTSKPTSKRCKNPPKIIHELNALPGQAGYFTETFCERSRFFQPKNGARIDAIREFIESKDFEPELKAVLLVSLMEAADRVDSTTTGVQMAYLKKWAARSPTILSFGFLNFCHGLKPENVKPTNSMPSKRRSNSPPM